MLYPLSYEGGAWRLPVIQVRVGAERTLMM
jgi:hypothetical protein